MARPKRERKQYTVGDKSKGADFSPEEIELIILKLRDWFISPECDRNYEDPLERAKTIVRRALLAELEDGSPWRNCGKTFQSRIKTLASYDIDTDTGIPTSPIKNPLAQRRLDREAQESAKEVEKYQVDINFNQEKYRQEKERAIFEQFPELNNEAHAPVVRRLSFLYTQQELIDRELSLPGISSKRRYDAIEVSQRIGKDIETTLNLLGIHPNQLRQAIAKQKQATIAELVAQLDDDEEFQERTRIWALQTALQLWYMTQHPNGKGDGPQLEPWEVWHMTRTLPFEFTCACGRYYPALIQGFTPDDLKEYLIKRGVLLEEPTLPGIVSPKDLKGLAPPPTPENADDEAADED